MSKNLVIVESPAKAHTIEKYLGADFKVLASVGHIRKDTKVDKGTFEVTYEIDPGHQSIITELRKEAKAADKIWLATDEDREGESISWHLLEVLKLPKDTARITFHEITKSALEAAIKSPRTVDMDMVASQQARQTLDMLVGYDLSDIVRRKVPGAISAGRVQSPALRLVVEREKEIEKFEAKSSFKVTGEFCSGVSGGAESGPRPSGPSPRADGAIARAAALRDAPDSVPSLAPAPSLPPVPSLAPARDTTALRDAPLSAPSPALAQSGPDSVPSSSHSNHNSPTPDASFTATYDGEAPADETAARALLERLSVSQFVVTDVEEAEGTKANPVPFTTAALQIEANAKLGFSSRTTMSAAQGLYQAGLITYHRTDSLNLSAQAIAAMAGYIKAEFGPEYLKTRHFKTKDAGAQEAHEAIRPTDVRRVAAGKNDYEKRLYQLIWARTLATQMANAKVAKTTIRIVASKADAFTAKGEVVIFDGFLRVYGKSKDLELPKVAKGDQLDCLGLTAKQNFAKPPARYTEGSLVKKLEELGIGRPSTYASIMTAIQARGYVVKGESDGEGREVIVLSARPDAATLTRETTKEKYGASKGKLLPTPIGELVAGFLTDNFKSIVDYKFTANIEKDLDLVAEAKLERVKMLRDFYGPFHDLVLIAQGVERYNNAKLLGHDPATGKPIYAKVGKSGGFIQLGDNEKDAGEKPRFAPLPKRKSVKTVTLEQALKQLALPALPRRLGKASDGAELIAANGPFGPYLKAGKYNIPMKDFDPYTVTLEEALPLYQQKIDSMIADWGEIQIINGAYGPYVKGPGRRNHAKIPKDIDPKQITLEQAKKMLEDKPKTTTRTRRGARGGARRGARKTTKK